MATANAINKAVPTGVIIGTTDTQTLTNKTINFTSNTIQGTAHRMWYTDGSGALVELAHGASGTYLGSNGATSAPTWSTPAGSGDVSKVGTPVDNEIGVWTGDGTLEGDTNFQWDGTNNIYGPGSGIVTGTGAGNTLLLRAYDVDGVSYTTFATLTANNTPTMDLSTAVTIGGNTIADTSTAQTFTNKTLTAPLVTTNGSIDVTGAGTLAIGASMGANNLTLGGATSTVVVAGDLTVNGTTTTINSATLDVDDSNISVNVGGSQATADTNDAGLTVTMTDATDGIIHYDSANTATFWKVGIVGTTYNIVGDTATQTLTNKTLTTPTIGDFTNATHDHTNAAGGGQLSITGATTGTLTETRGGTNQTTYTTGDILYASGANTLAKLAAGTNGHVLTLAAGIPSWAAAPAGGLSTVEVTGTTQSMAADTIYIANNAAQITFTLPSAPSVGDIVAVVGYGAGGWRVTPNASQRVQVGNVTGATGATGVTDSSNQYDAIEFICTDSGATDVFVARSIIGNVDVTT